MSIQRKRRRGALIALMAITLPIIVLVGIIAVNIASIQLARTELQIATDAAARAGGRAWSEHQDQTIARDFAFRAAALNKVNGRGLDLDVSENSSEIEFGRSRRTASEGRFVFTPMLSGDNQSPATGVRVNSTLDDLLLFRVGDEDSFRVTASSVASQIDRDISLVVDRSGSMAYYQDEDDLYNTMTALYEDSSNEISRDEYEDALADYQAVPEFEALRLNQRQYSQKVIDLLSGDLKQYAITMNTRYRVDRTAPDFSRWAVLEEASDAFLDVLTQSDQTELVAISSFASDADLELSLTEDLQRVHDRILELRPTGSTAIGRGMQEGIQALLSDQARDDAVPTIIVFSDGQNKKGIPPEVAAEQIVADHPRVVINTVTFAAGDQTEMKEVARIGGGSHFHASSGPELVNVFKKLAASFRTIITE